MDLNHKMLEFEKFEGIAEEKITRLEQRLAETERRLKAVEEELKKVKTRA